MAFSEKHTAQSLAGKVALVSGSSSGIGAAIARELSSRGAHVIINYPYASEKSNADRVLQSLPGTAKSVLIEADLSTWEGPKALAIATANEFGHIDILVNNAGRSLNLPLDSHDDGLLKQTWHALIDTNGRGTYLLTREVLQHLSPQNCRIINIASDTSRNPPPNVSLYAGTKGMIESFTRCWARDLPRTYGCTVNTVAPGPTSTEAMAEAPEEHKRQVQKVLDATPMGPRMGRPEEVAFVVASLCEEGMGWVNGVYIPVSGGATFT